MKTLTLIALALTLAGCGSDGYTYVNAAASPLPYPDHKYMCEIHHRHHGKDYTETVVCDVQESCDEMCHDLCVVKEHDQPGSKCTYETLEKK